ncbi:hypothetical protein CC117_07230 [Parafrankia colletiae]|uniref:Uncharacterized protein n=1 Tax=Parafrankia colletiae TaxID=573497 RepID=A0A1S1Q9Q3_9ACTN|nr:hypothetical protein [Parafrankia colletiae]MCK9899639.1 hypothetical protein [Frankia sp. Cpl3]OHV30690.1 hypothetical protein CC117_07230 [Parafrankia colletiae]
MLDVEVPAGVNPASGRVAGAGAATWAQQNRSVLVAGSFVVAVVLGVVLGLAWASDTSAPAGTTATEQPDNPILRQPTPPTIPWDSQNPRVAVGDALSLSLQPGEREALREPLRWLAAYEVRDRTGAAAPVLADVKITENTLFYGAVRGVDVQQDEFWAVGMTEIAGVSGAEAPNPHVWKRVRSEPWTLVDNGPQACTKIPAVLRTVWGGPSSCAAS